MTSTVVPRDGEPTSVWPRRKKGILTILRKDRALLLLALPGVMYFLVFKYLPMWGVSLSFIDYQVYKGFFASEWVGFKNFVDFFTAPAAWRVIRNTFMINLYIMVFGFPAPIIFALLLNELRNEKFKRVTQTISYLPHFISSVIVAGLVINFLDPRFGPINRLLVNAFGIGPVNFLMEARYFKGIYVVMKIWQTFGWNSIIYLAAITAIPQEQYEAAIIDGASRFKQAIYITLPGIIPVATILLILNLGYIMDVGFEEILLLYNPLTYETADVISTYVYRKGLVDMDYSYATAVGLFQSIVGLFFVLSANRISRKVSETSLW